MKNNLVDGDIIDEDGLLNAGEIQIIVLGAGKDIAYSRVRTNLWLIVHIIVQEKAGAPTVFLHKLCGIGVFKE